MSAINVIYTYDNIRNIILIPVILKFDGERRILNAVERDLRRRFGADYRILKAPSGEEALRTIKELKKRNAQVALLLVDQRMPSMSGTELIGEAVKIFPDAKKALLTAYADTQTAIASINEIGLDCYPSRGNTPVDAAIL